MNNNELGRPTNDGTAFAELGKAAYHAGQAYFSCEGGNLADGIEHSYEFADHLTEGFKQLINAEAELLADNIGKGLPANPQNGG